MLPACYPIHGIWKLGNKIMPDAPKNAKKFTEQWIKSIPAPCGSERLEFADTICVGLKLRVGRRAKTFYVVGRDRNRQVYREKLGVYPDLSLKEARTLASQTSDAKKKSAHRRKRELGTFEQLCRNCVAQMKAEERPSASEFERVLLNGPHSAVAFFGSNTTAREITKESITEWLRTYHKRGVGTRVPREVLSAAFSRGMKADNDPRRELELDGAVFDLQYNPVTAVGGGGPSNAGNRSLTAGEIWTVWREFNSAGVHPRTLTAIRMIVAMGGVRVTEVLCSRKEFWDLKKGLLTTLKTKNTTEMSWPLPEHAKEQLIVAMNLSPTASPFLFPNQENLAESQHHSSLSQAVRRWCDGRKFERFSPRDLRRTMKTLLLDRFAASKAIDERDLEIWHNHGKHATVARRHYDRAQYEMVKQNVADRIDVLLTEILSAQSAHEAEEKSLPNCAA